MKTNVSYFCQQFRHTYEGEPWYGDSLRHKLASVSAGEAFALPARGVHSIAQLVAHMLAWRRLLVERLKGNGDFRIESDSVLDWPPTATLQTKGWANLLAEFEEHQAELLRLLEAETDELLERPLPDGRPSFRLLLDGVVQHDVYHIGQIGVVLCLLRTAVPA